MIQLWAWRVACAIWQKLPTPLGYKLASILADLVYFSWGRGRRMTRENMNHVLGSQADPVAVDKLARQSLRNYCKYMVEFIRFPLLQPRDIQEQVRFDDWNRMEVALEGGKGAIFVGMHLGNWDIGAAAVAQRGLTVNVIAESFDHPKLNEMVQETRKQFGVNVIMLEEVGISLLRVLRRNEILAFLIDNPSDEDGVVVRFFDGEITVPGGAATLALKTGARIVPATAVRLADGTFLVLLDHYIQYQPCGNLKTDIQALTQRIMSSLEGIVRQYPDQWYMFRRMWPELVC